jgi:hypothetical protein
VAGYRIWDVTRGCRRGPKSAILRDRPLNYKKRENRGKRGKQSRGQPAVKMQGPFVFSRRLSKLPSCRINSTGVLTIIERPKAVIILTSGRRAEKAELGLDDISLPYFSFDHSFPRFPHGLPQTYSFLAFLYLDRLPL